jgi:hypothetical protein
VQARLRNARTAVLLFGSPSNEQHRDNGIAQNSEPKKAVILRCRRIPQMKLEVNSLSWLTFWVIVTSGYSSNTGVNLRNLRIELLFLG